MPLLSAQLGMAQFKAALKLISCIGPWEEIPVESKYSHRLSMR